MRRTAVLCCIAVLVGCAKSEEKAADTTPTMAAPAPPPPAPLTLADVAGKWNFKGMNEAGDSTVVTYVLTATADTTGWTITFPKRKPEKVRVVSVAGDSVTVSMGPFASAIRKGVTVKTESVVRLKDGKMVGMATAHYTVKTPDSVRVIRLEGTKAP